MKRILFAVGLTISCGTVAAACSSSQMSSARTVRKNMAGLGSSQNRNGNIEYKFGPAYENMTPSEKKGVIEAYANADACLSGGARKILFYYKGKLVGRADPDSGISIIDR